jgi:hypothetical protein
MCRARQWADLLGVPCSTATSKVVCSQHFSEVNFTFSECICLKRMVLPTVCATFLHNEAQCGVSATVHACDMKMFSVAYVSGFTASSCDICKKCLISEVPDPLDIYTGFKDHSSTYQSLTYPTEKLV